MERDCINDTVFGVSYMTALSLFGKGYPSVLSDDTMELSKLHTNFTRPSAGQREIIFYCLQRLMDIFLANIHPPDPQEKIRM